MHDWMRPYSTRVGIVKRHQSFLQASQPSLSSRITARMDEHHAEVVWNVVNGCGKSCDVLRHHNPPVGHGRRENRGIVLALKVTELDGDDVNLRAAETFSLNDFASNGGIIVAGGLVLWLDQSWPDLVVGVIVAGIAARGGLEILEDARKAQAEAAD